jgi:hypothetical protein
MGKLTKLTDGEREGLSRVMKQKPSNHPTAKKTTRKYTCGCKVFRFTPDLEWKPCKRHRWQVAAEPFWSYELALGFIERLGAFEMVYPKRKVRR